MQNALEIRDGGLRSFHDKRPRETELFTENNRSLSYILSMC